MINRLTLDRLPRVRVTLRARAAPRLHLGHAWVFSTEIEGFARPGGAHAAPPGQTAAETPSDRSPGPALAEVVEPSGRLVGRGVLNPASSIAVRLFTHGPEPKLDGSLLERRAEAALERRAGLLRGQDPRLSACRVVHAEADGLPGLIVDKLGPALVFQSLAAAAEVCVDRVLPWLAGALGSEYVVERNDAPVRLLEGLPQVKGSWPPGAPVPPGGLVSIDENGLRFRVDVLEGQKTGFYLDQRENRSVTRRLAAELAARAAAGPGRGVDVLDCFAYTGGFALAAASGAGERLGRLVCVESSLPALELGRANFAAHGLGDRVELLQANAFDELRRLERAGAAAVAGRGQGSFDLIILDPPPFARERRMVPGALRGYKEINLRALKLLRGRGYLITCNCSHHIGRDAFGEVLAEAAADAGAAVRVVEVRGQPPDHPVLLGQPEGDYLTCYVLERACFG